MRLPDEYKGYSTLDLLDLWERMHAHETNGSEKEKAGVMNMFLREYNLMPVLWPLDETHKIHKQKAQERIAELKSRHIQTAALTQM